MPATNEQFIKAAFEAGLTEEQVRQAVAERNQQMSAPKTPVVQPPIQPPQPQQPSGNPIMNAAAKTQEFLGNSSTLPITGGVMGRATVKNPIGTGIGTAVGVMGQRQLRPENAGMRELKITDLIGINNPMSQGLTPINKPLQNKDYTDALKIGAEAAAWDFALTKVLPNIFRPGKTLSKVRDYLSKGKTVDEKVVYKLAEEALNKPGAAAKVDIKNAKKILAEIKPEMGNVISAKDAFTEKSAQWMSGLTKTGYPKAGAEKTVSRVIANAYRDALKEAAPMAQRIDAPISFVKQAPRSLQGAMRAASYAGQTLFGFEALRRALGQ